MIRLLRCFVVVAVAGALGTGCVVHTDLSGSTTTIPPSSAATTTLPFAPIDPADGVLPTKASTRVGSADVFAAVAKKVGEPKGWWSDGVHGAVGLSETTITVELAGTLKGQDALSACSDVTSALSAVRPEVVVWVHHDGAGLQAFATATDACRVAVES